MNDPDTAAAIAATSQPSCARSRRCSCGLERQVRAWLDGRRTFPLTMLQRAELEGLADDLRRQAEALDVDRPLLVIMLMGGTGVGKSTLLNALAGGTIAQASFTRPTTRDPVVYYHQSVQPDRLDPALRLCRLVPHDRAGLEQKIIVDTPDLDSNDLANREKLLAPAARRRHRALRRLAGEVPRPARLGAVQGAAASGGRSRSCSTSGTAASRAKAACGPTRTCSRT